MAGVERPAVQIESLKTELEQIASRDPSCVRLQQIPGVGPLVSTAVVSAIGNGATFKKGREFAAWLATGAVLEYPVPTLCKGQNTTAPVISDSPRAGVDDVWYASKRRRGIRVTSFSREMIASTGPLIDGQEKRQE